MGYLQTDGYSGYSQIGEALGIVHVGRMVHIRRKFYEADKIASGSGDAAEILSMIATLYHNEALLRQRYGGKKLDEPRSLVNVNKFRGHSLRRYMSGSRHEV